MSDYLTVPEAAAFLRISARKVYDLVGRGGLPHRRAGARLLFERLALAEWVRAGGDGWPLAAPPIVLAGSHDALMDWAVRASQSPMATLARGSRDGLERVLKREACAALLHLPGRSPERFNIDAVEISLAGHDVALVNWCWRQQGLIVAAGNPRRIAALADLRGAGRPGRPGRSDRSDRPGVRLGRRIPGAGSRESFDRLLAAAIGTAAAARLDPAVDDLASENDAALAVRHGQVDAVFGAESAARSFGLGFVPILRERVDLLVNRRSYFEPPLQALLAFCRTPAFAEQARLLGGYDLSDHGRAVWNAG